MLPCMYPRFDKCVSTSVPYPFLVSFLPLPQPPLPLIHFHPQPSYQPPHHHSLFLSTPATQWWFQSPTRVEVAQYVTPVIHTIEHNKENIKQGDAINYKRTHL